MARQRLLEAPSEHELRNPVFLTGDWHSTFVNDLKLDFKQPESPTIATEFVTPAITTGGDDTPYGPYYAPMIPFNPHIKYYEGDRRGYFKATVTPARDAVRPALRHQRREPGRDRLRREVLGGRGWAARARNA